MKAVVWGTLVVTLSLSASVSHAEAPPQRLPSAVLQYPLVVVENGGQTRDTRIELVNLTSRPLQVHCFYVNSGFCGATNFFVYLTPNQPMSWLASRGTTNRLNGSAAPPFFGTGELKCVVLPSRPELDAHNALQGRAIIFGSDGQTQSYGAVGFRRLIDGDYTNLVELDGSTYTQCPGELHFAFLASNATSDSELVIAPCSQDLENLQSATTAVSFRVINEFEQLLSASMIVTCFDRRPLRRISPVFTEDFLGSPTGHVIMRGVQVPVIGLLIDHFTDGAVSTSANEPFLRDGRSAVLRFP